MVGKLTIQTDHPYTAQGNGRIELSYTYRASKTFNKSPIDNSTINEHMRDPSILARFIVNPGTNYTIINERSGGYTGKCKRK